jgi:hypothetical protein
MTTDYWVWELQILDDGLKLSLVLLGDLATEDDGDLLGLADGPIGIQQSLAELIQLIQCSSPVKDQVVTTFNFREEEPALTTGFFALAFPVSETLKRGGDQPNTRRQRNTFAERGDPYRSVERIMMRQKSYRRRSVAKSFLRTR